MYAVHHRALWEDMTDPKHGALFACRLLLKKQQIKDPNAKGYNKYRTKELLVATDGDFWWPITAATFSNGTMNQWLTGRPLPTNGPKYIVSRAARFQPIHLGTKDKNRVQNAIKKFCTTITE